MCVNLIDALSCKRVVEKGCGFGHLTDRISRVCNDVIGVDISPTAISKASIRYPSCKFQVSTFPDFELLRSLKPDCILMAEITWYVIDELDAFIDFLKTEMPDTVLIHLLMTYKKGEQKYGSEKFTNLAEIKNYFGMNYLESGELEKPEMNGG